MHQIETLYFPSERIEKILFVQLLTQAVKGAVGADTIAS